MAARENVVYSTSTQFSSSFKESSPEGILYGYAKLLLMEESSVKNLIPEQAMPDLEAARQFMKDSKLDLDLIRSGLLLLMPVLQISSENQAKRDKLAEFINDCPAQTGSVEILKKALEVVAIPMADVFGVGKSLDDVFAYQEKLKAAMPPKEEASKKSSDDSEEEVRKAPKEREKEEPQVEPAKKEKLDFYGLAEKYRNLSGALFDVVKGQDQAVLKFVQGCFQGEVLLDSEKKHAPRSYFFFFGPPGTGKTLLARTAAENMGMPYKIFDMSEYSTDYGHEELMGTPKMFKNTKEGTLAKFVRENPECLLVFDEIEKAHPLVIKLFLQILGSGKMNNVSREEDVDFTKTTIIFTSNVGKELYADRSVNLTTLPEKVILDAIRSEKNAYGQQILPNEICSRIASGNMVLFNHLSIRHLAGMVKDNFNEVSRAMEEMYHCRLTYASALPLLFIYNKGGEIDARMAVGQSNHFLKNEIYELARQIEKSVDRISKMKSIHFDIDWDGIDPALKHLFANTTKSEILVMAGEANRKYFAFDENKYVVHYAENVAQARELIKRDVVAVFIDPFLGKRDNNHNILSIADYNTEGVAFFHEITDKNLNLPIYLLEIGEEFSDVDRKTFLMEGAANTMRIKEGQEQSFAREFEQLMDELYMERESQNFTQQGWVIDFKTKQDMSASDGQIRILFYDLRKRMALDMESRDALLNDAERPNIHFHDVIGASKAKDELGYFIEYLRNPKRFVMEGGKPPKGVLLYGPPGTGKTMLAKAMAGESSVNFIQTNAAAFLNQWMGESEANVRRLFARARKYAPAIIFIDEIDAIGKKRTGSESTVSVERVLNALLTEMDGFSSDNKKPVFVLAATNYGVGGSGDGIASLDEALIRRFDNKIYVDLPNQEERKEYITRMTGKYKSSEITQSVIDNLAERTTGQSLAILQNVIDLAYRNASKEKRGMQDNDLLNALEEYLYGEKRERTPEYYRSVAIHETGHAYISYLSGDKPSYLTIESRGDFGGYMQHGNAEDIPSYTKEDILGKIRTSLAGRAAEMVFYGETKALNTGASSDLEHATNYAFRMICSFGMAGQLASLTRDQVFRSALAEKYVDRVNEILDEQMKETIRLIEDGRDTITKIADELVKQNHLTGEEFKMLMES